MTIAILYYNVKYNCFYFSVLAVGMSLDLPVIPRGVFASGHPFSSSYWLAVDQRRFLLYMGLCVRECYYSSYIENNLLLFVSGLVQIKLLGFS